MGITLIILMASVISIGAGNGNTAQSQQFFDRLISPPTAMREYLYSSLINGLEVDGTWSKLDGLYLFAAADEGTALTNVVSGSYRASYPTDPSDYTVDRFLSPQDGVTTISYNFNPATAGGHYAQNSACLFGWNLTTANAAGWIMGTSTSNIELVPKDATGHTLLALNSSSKDDLGTGVTNAAGLFVANRTASDALTLDRNGVRIATLTTASVAPESLAMTSSYVAAQIAIAGFGAALTDPQLAALYVRLQTYLRGVGAI